MSGHHRWREVLARESRRLQDAGVEGAARDARLLLGLALGVDMPAVISRENDPADPLDVEKFVALVTRRAAGEPISRIRGWREFYGRPFQISRDVLDPRPETELLVELAIKGLPMGGKLLDLGVGSGCVLMSVLAERPDATGVGLDRSLTALAVARRNAEAMGLAHRLTLVEGDWADGAAHAPFDMIVSNPPYIPTGELEHLAREVRDHDPALALDGGSDGLAAYRRIALLAGGMLSPDGRIALEVGQGQAEDVLRLLEQEGLRADGIVNDLAQIARVVTARIGSTR